MRLSDFSLFLVLKAFFYVFKPSLPVADRFFPLHAPVPRTMGALLPWDLCFGALAAQSPYTSSKRSLEDPAGRGSLASAKADRAALRSPQWHGRLPEAAGRLSPSLMERLEAGRMTAMTANCSLKPDFFQGNASCLLAGPGFPKNKSGKKRRRLREKRAMKAHVRNLLVGQAVSGKIRKRVLLSSRTFLLLLSRPTMIEGCFFISPDAAKDDRTGKTTRLTNEHTSTSLSFPP